MLLCLIPEVAKAGESGSELALESRPRHLALGSGRELTSKSSGLDNRSDNVREKAEEYGAGDE